MLPACIVGESAGMLITVWGGYAVVWNQSCAQEANWFNGG